MALSYAQIQTRISRLSEQAEKAKAKEAEGVIAKIKDAIEFYGLTAADLFDSQPRAAAPSKKKPKNGAKVKFRDEAGNTWGGMGKRPQWVHDAVAAGKTLDEFRV